MAVSLVAVLRTPYSLPPSCFAATVAVLNLLQEDTIIPNNAQNLSIEYDVTTYAINHPLSMSPGIYHEPLVWDIPTLDKARELLAQISVKDAKIVKSVEYYYSDQAAQNRRLSALADHGIMACIELHTPTRDKASGVVL